MSHPAHRQGNEDISRESATRNKLLKFLDIIWHHFLLKLMHGDILKRGLKFCNDITTNKNLKRPWTNSILSNKPNTAKNKTINFLVWYLSRHTITCCKNVDICSALTLEPSFTKTVFSISYVPLGEIKQELFPNSWPYFLGSGKVSHTFILSACKNLVRYWARQDDLQMWHPPEHR